MFKSPILPRKQTWSDWDEWKFVYNLLFNKNPNIIHALNIIKRWSIRGFLPSNIESTLSLFTCLININKQDDYSLRLMMTMSIIRFVNSIVDPQQTQQQAMSVLGLAKKMNLPPGVVQIRHSGTHQQLPEKAVLVELVEECIEWLHLNYWVIQIEELNFCKKKICDFLQKYKQLKKKKLKDTDSKKIHDPIEKKMQNLKKQFIEFLKYYNGSINDFIMVFFSENFLFKIPDHLDNESHYLQIFQRLKYFWEEFLISIFTHFNEQNFLLLHCLYQSFKESEKIKNFKNFKNFKKKCIITWCRILFDIINFQELFCLQQYDLYSVEFLNFITKEILNTSDHEHFLNIKKKFSEKINTSKKVNYDQFEFNHWTKIDFSESTDNLPPFGSYVHLKKSIFIEDIMENNS